MDELRVRLKFPRFRRHLKVMVRNALKRLWTYAADMAEAARRIINIHTAMLAKSILDITAFSS